MEDKGLKELIALRAVIIVWLPTFLLAFFLNLCLNSTMLFHQKHLQNLLFGYPFSAVLT